MAPPTPPTAPQVTAPSVTTPPEAAPEATAPQATAPTVTTPPESTPQATAQQTLAQPRTATQVAHPESAQLAEDEMPPSRPQPSRRTLVTGGILVLLLIAGGVALADPFGPDDAPPEASSPAKTAAAGYAVKVTDVTTDCAGHSRGRTKASFEAENCVKATRLLATGEVGGRPVLYVVSRIEMASGEAAASVKQVLDGNGTGNINDLLRDGKTYAGAPAEMPISGYASLQEGTVVTVAEAGFVDEGRSSSEDPALRSAAARVAGTVARG